MDWNRINVADGSSLTRIHNFMFMLSGRNYILEINEYPDGHYVGYAELTNDDSKKFAPASGGSIEDCVNNLLTICQSS